mmetsp:Transcript_21747/g.68383  ORF Transcript_21747/g.68383 Transcript_21747/m.68383 type:complete len:255 (+) Transcript_21747:338-1102(+)
MSAPASAGRACERRAPRHPPGPPQSQSPRGPSGAGLLATGPWPPCAHALRAWHLPRQRRAPLQGCRANPRSSGRLACAESLGCSRSRRPRRPGGCARPRARGPAARRGRRGPLDARGAPALGKQRPGRSGTTGRGPPAAAGWRGGSSRRSCARYPRGAESSRSAVPAHPPTRSRPPAGWPLTPGLPRAACGPPAPETAPRSRPAARSASSGADTSRPAQGASGSAPGSRGTIPRRAPTPGAGGRMLEVWPAPLP